MLHCFPWPHLRSFRWNCGSHYCFPTLSFLSNNKEIFHHYCYWLDSSWILWKLPNFSSFQNVAHVEIDFHSFWYNLYRHWMDNDWTFCELDFIPIMILEMVMTIIIAIKHAAGVVTLVTLYIWVHLHVLQFHYEWTQHVVFWCCSLCLHVVYLCPKTSKKRFKSSCFE